MKKTKKVELERNDVRTFLMRRYHGLKAALWIFAILSFIVGVFVVIAAILDFTMDTAILFRVKDYNNDFLGNY